MRAAYLAPLWLLALAGCVSPFRVPDLDPTADIGETVGKQEAPDPAVLPIISSEPVAANPDRAIENYRKLLELVTNTDGRTDAPILPQDAFEPGTYELIFHAGDYLRASGQAGDDPLFLDQVPIRFGMSDPDAHYHVPLLLSPFGYSTYRGS